MVSLESARYLVGLTGEVYMSIQLKFNHKDGLRLRQQMAHSVDRTSDGIVVSGKEWRFEGADVDQDRDLRKVDGEGKHIKLGTYTVFLTAGMKNLVVEKKGKVEHIDFRNSSLRNQMKVRMQTLIETKKAKDGKTPVMEWKDSGTAQYIPSNTWSGVSVGDGVRSILDEMPT